MFLLRALLSCIVVATVNGHGRLIDPPSRSSAWRWGYPNPSNFNDMELFCGGAAYLANQNGICGVCGDPWIGNSTHPGDDPENYKNEAGGIYANGIIVGAFDEGQILAITVDLTANHKGWFEFKLCPNNDPTKRITHDCLDQYLLPLAGQFASMGTRYQLADDLKRNHTIPVQLPTGLTCSQCVLQWRYHTANSWGTDPDGTGCLGCGYQEEFYGCADISIGSGYTVNPTVTTTHWVDTSTTTEWDTTTTASTAAPTTTDSGATTTAAPTTTDSGATTTTGVITTCDDACAGSTGATFFNHPNGNCAWYCQCDGSIGHEFQCSQGLCFNTSCNCCDWASK